MSNDDQTNEMPAGWYPSPDGGPKRYWDGERWLALPDPAFAQPEPLLDSLQSPLESKRPREWFRNKKILASVGAALVLVAGGVTALVLKTSHDSDVRAKQAAAASSSKRAADDEAARQASERASRTRAVHGIESSVQEMAEKHVADGLFDGPIISTTCDPVEGGSTDDLSEKTTVFECFVATKDNGDGTLSGRKYHATMNWSSGSYTYGYGAP